MPRRHARSNASRRSCCLRAITWNVAPGWRAITSSSASSSSPSERRLGTSRRWRSVSNQFDDIPSEPAPNASSSSAAIASISSVVPARSHASRPMTDARSALCAVYANGCTAVACSRARSAYSPQLDQPQGT